MNLEASIIRRHLRAKRPKRSRAIVPLGSPNNAGALGPYLIRVARRRLLDAAKHLLFAATSRSETSALKAVFQRRIVLYVLVRYAPQPLVGVVQVPRLAQFVALHIMFRTEL